MQRAASRRGSWRCRVLAREVARAALGDEAARALKEEVGRPPPSSGVSGQASPPVEREQDQAERQQDRAGDHLQFGVGRGLRQRDPSGSDATTGSGRFAARELDRAVAGVGAPLACGGAGSCGRSPNTFAKSQPAGRLSGRSVSLSGSPSGRLGVLSTATRLVSRVTS